MNIAIDGLKHFPGDMELISISINAREMLHTKVRMACRPGMPAVEGHETSMGGGQVTVVPYPWFAATYLSRPSDRICSIASSLALKSSCCEIRLKGGAIANGRIDSYGIYATRPIRRGQVIFGQLNLISNAKWRGQMLILQFQRTRHLSAHLPILSLVQYAQCH